MSATGDSTAVAPVDEHELTNPREHYYQSEVFKLVVGPQNESFIVHREKLEQSPVFKRMCNSGFIEAETKKINLPDDDPKSVAMLVEYLYRGDYWPFKGPELETYRSQFENQIISEMQPAADLYCLAAMYDLKDLQELVVEKMKILTPMTFSSFMTLSEHIYNNSDASGPFRTYCRSVIEHCLPQISRGEWLSDQVARGGDLAVELFSAESRPIEIIDGTLTDTVFTWPFDMALPYTNMKKKSKGKGGGIRSSGI